MGFFLLFSLLIIFPSPEPCRMPLNMKTGGSRMMSAVATVAITSSRWVQLEKYRNLKKKILQAVLTHKGRSSNSGHYVGWVRYEPDFLVVLNFHYGSRVRKSA